MQKLGNALQNLGIAYIFKCCYDNHGIYSLERKKGEPGIKKLFALLLVVAMVISMAACIPADTDATTAGKLVGTTASEDTTIVMDTTDAISTPWNTYDCFDLTGIVADNKINVGITVNATVTSYDENDLTKYMESLTGLDIEFTFFSSDPDKRKQQLNQMIANEEKLPDVLFGIVDVTMASEYGRKGLLCDITEFLNNSPRLSRWMEAMTDYERNYFLTRLPDGVTGEIYHVPTPFRNTGVDAQEWIGAISSTMAENVGMVASEIDTIDEVYQYLYKTVKEDGNKNGKADEIGLIFRQNGYRANAEMWIINAYVHCTDTYIFNATDGEIWVPYNTLEYRQALITMNKWYSEGLISPMAYTLNDAAEPRSLVDAGSGSYTVVAWGGHPNLVCKAVSNGGQIGRDYTCMNTLADETGKGGYANIRDTYGLLKNAVIPMNEAEPERMEVAYLFCDLQYDWEVHKHWRYGVEITEEGGEGNWMRIDGEALGLKDKDGNWAGYEVISDNWPSETDDTWQFDPVYADATNAVVFGLSPGGTPLDTGTWAETGDRFAITYGCLWEKMEHKQPTELVYDLVYTLEETKVMNQYKKLYTDFVKSARAQMVTGVIDPSNDTVWDNYLKELKANGEDELIKAAQAAYTRMNG